MQVDFYLLGTGDPLDLTVRLVARAWPEFSPLVVTGPAERLGDLDDRLWQAPAGRFLPHGIDDPSAPIRLQTAAPASAAAWINLDGSCRTTGSDFDRVLEIVPGDEAARAAARNRYRAWRDAGADIRHHKLK